MAQLGVKAGRKLGGLKKNIGGGRKKKLVGDSPTSFKDFNPKRIKRRANTPKPVDAKPTAVDMIAKAAGITPQTAARRLRAAAGIKFLSGTY